MQIRNLAVCAALLAAVSGGAGAVTSANKLKDRLTGDDKTKAADNPQCKLFTAGEIAKYLGQAVKPGENAASGTGCSWSATKEDGADALVQVVPARYFVAPREAKGFKSLPSVGTKGYVAQDWGGWSAGAVVGDQGVVVNISGKTATESSAVALLEETNRRRKP